jgi:hypothetical protein
MALFPASGYFYGMKWLEKDGSKVEQILVQLPCLRQESDEEFTELARKSHVAGSIAVVAGQQSVFYDNLSAVTAVVTGNA